MRLGHINTLGECTSELPDMFYDVPLPMNISAPVTDYRGIPIVGGRMQIAIFDCPFEAMSFASRMKHASPGGVGLDVNYRKWDKTIFASSHIIKH